MNPMQSPNTGVGRKLYHNPEFDDAKALYASWSLKQRKDFVGTQYANLSFDALPWVVRDHIRTQHVKPRQA